MAEIGIAMKAQAAERRADFNASLAMSPPAVPQLRRVRRRMQDGPWCVGGRPDTSWTGGSRRWLNSLYSIFLWLPGLHVDRTYAATVA